MVFEGDFVQGVILDSTDAEPETGFNQFAFPSINDSPPSVVGGGDTIIAFNGRPRDAGVRQVPGDARGVGDLGHARRLLVAQHERRRERLPGRRSPGRRPRRWPTPRRFRFDMSDLAPSAFGGTVGQGEWKILQDFLQEPERHPGHAAGARDGGGEGLRAVIDHGDRQHHGGAPEQGAPPGAGDGGPGPGPPAPVPRRARASCRRRSCSWASGSSTRRSTRSSAASTTGPATSFVGFDNYKTLFTDRRPADGDQEQRDLGRSSCRRSVTAIGLVFAVLTERIRWSVAFKTAVFMPMAISLFAAGVIWHIMYEQDPSAGDRQRGHRGGRTTP